MAIDLQKEITPLYRRIMSDHGDSPCCAHCGFPNEIANAIRLARVKLAKGEINVNKTLVVAETRETRSSNFKEYERLAGLFGINADDAETPALNERVVYLEAELAALRQEIATLRLPASESKHRRTKWFQGQPRCNPNIRAFLLPEAKQLVDADMALHRMSQDPWLRMVLEDYFRRIDKLPND